MDYYKHLTNFQSFQKVDLDPLFFLPVFSLFLWRNGFLEFPTLLFWKYSPFTSQLSLQKKCSLLFHYFKDVALLSSCLHCFQWQIWCCSLFLLYVTYLFSLASFKILSVSLVWSNFITMCLYVVFFMFPVLEFIELLGSMGLYFSLISESFISSNMFSVPLLSFGDYISLHMRPLEIIPQLIIVFF